VQRECINAVNGTATDWHRVGNGTPLIDLEVARITDDMYSDMLVRVSAH